MLHKRLLFYYASGCVTQAVNFLLRKRLLLHKQLTFYYASGWYYINRDYYISSCYTRHMCVIRYIYISEFEFMTRMLWPNIDCLQISLLRQHFTYCQPFCENLYGLCLVENLTISSIFDSACPDTFLYVPSFDGCFMFVMEALNWQAARDNCNAMGGHLDAMYTGAELNFIFNHLRQRYLQGNFQ